MMKDTSKSKLADHRFLKGGVAMKAFLRYPRFRFFYAAGTALLLASCALFVFVAVSVLLARQPSVVLAQGSGARTITHTITSDFDVCTVLPSTMNRVFTDSVASSADGGEIRLAALLEDYFDGTEVNTATWVITERYSGPPVVGGGFLTMVNSGVRSVISVPVSARVFQARARMQQPGGETGWGDIGFGRRVVPGSYSVDEAHRLFITDDSNRVYANAVDDGGTRYDELIEGVDLTQFHLFEIEWDATATYYYIDGTYFPTATIYSTFVYEPYVWLFTDQFTDTVDVDWVRVSYYPTTTGQYESCVVDGGLGFSEWTSITWGAELPSGTSATFETRSSSDGSTWSAWAQVGGSGSAIPSPDSRYLQYRATLTTTDVYASPEIGSVVIGYDSDAPFADAGGPYTASEGVSLELDGSGSTDPDNDIVDYEWDLDYDGSFDIDATGITATVSFPDGPETRTIALRVRDEDGYTDEQSTTVTVSNVAPTAEAGGPYTVDEGDSTSLSGSGTDVPSDPLTYEWDLDDDGNYDDATGQTPTFDASSLDGPTTVTVTLQVSDGDGGVTTDTATISVDNVAPTVTNVTNTGPVDEGSPVTVTVTITDPSPLDTFQYRFDCDNNGSFEIDWQTSASAQCTFYDNTGSPFTVGAQGRDDDLDSSNVGTTAVTVNNVAPTAEAGGPYTVDEGDSVGLSGSATDPGTGDTLTYEWDLDNDGYYDDATGQTPTFDASSLDGPTIVTVGLQVSDDDGGVDTDSTTVTVNNVAPTADANGPYSVNEGSIIPLTGSGTDVPGDPLLYAWDLDDDTVFETAGANPNFDASSLDGPATVTVTLRVSDDDGGVTTDSTTVTVNNVAPTADAGGPYTVDEGGSVGLSGSGTDPMDTLSYAWDLDNDGYYDDATGQTPTFDASSLDGPATVTVTLQVSDGDGGVTTDSTTVTVNNVAPIADAGGPYTAGTDEVITFTVVITDALADSHTVEWDLDDNGTFESVGQTVTRTYAAEGDYQVAVRVTDDDGAWTTDVAQVTIMVYRVYLPLVGQGIGSSDGTSALVPSTEGRWTAEPCCPVSSGSELAGIEKYGHILQDQASEARMRLELQTQDLGLNAPALQEGWSKSLASGKCIDGRQRFIWSRNEQEGVV
jgi:hypothetical protein